MYFKQLVKEDLGCASYVVGCADAAVCAVIDPRIDMVDEIVKLVADKGMRITTIIETHLHADHLSGHMEMARRTGATTYVHQLAQVTYPHAPLQDGDELWCGAVKLQVIHTPGHRPEHIAMAVSDTRRSAAPWLVLTGDSLFIGDVARPDLAVAAEEGASALYESMFERLLHLDDGVEVYPGHVAGSLCGRSMSAKASSTIGFERKHNPTLTPRPRSTFIADLTSNLPLRPPTMATLVEHNRNGTALHPSSLSLTPFSAQSVQREMEHDALILYIGSSLEFCTAHIPGALFVDLHGSAFATRVGFIVPLNTRLILVSKHDHDLHEAVQQLSVVGYDRVIGFLQGGMTSWQEAGLPVQQLSQLTVEELLSSLDLTILDVRDQSEWDEGHIAGALHIPYYDIEHRFHTLDSAQALAVICGSGQRSMIACALLQRRNFTKVKNVIGGMEAWNKMNKFVEV